MEATDEEVAARAGAVLAEKHAAAVFDETEKVARPGFLVAPGASGAGRARVQHRTLFPSDERSTLSFADAAAEEFLLVEAYADLLRAAGWEVQYRSATRPNLLVAPPTARRGENSART
ncbi:hypothetical protein OG215_36940 (plasmid) [Streptomyces globisporus]|uniref:hypothetical protein n=1 Tax=Streptomyces globisporus TaxID=1908 RepID=UPI002F90B73D|nr:hypothetical protein OG215_36940 [Streptomyces globisporus]